MMCSAKMAPKSSGKSLKPRACKRGCKGRLIGPDILCDCIEAYLPSLRGRGVSVNASSYGDLSHIAIVDPNQEERETASLEHIELRLKRFGLAEHEVKLVLARAVDGQTFDEIIKEQPWTSRGAAIYHYNQAIKRLKRGGFQL